MLAIPNFLYTSLNTIITQMKACLTFIVEIALKIIQELGEAFHANNQKNDQEKNRVAHIVENKEGVLKNSVIKKQPLIEWPQSTNPRLVCLTKDRILPPSNRKCKNSTRVPRN